MPNIYSEWASAFSIFSKYAPDGFHVSAEHDILYAGPNPTDVDADDIVTLQELGWNPDDDLECFYHFA